MCSEYNDVEVFQKSWKLVQTFEINTGDQRRWLADVWHYHSGESIVILSMAVCEFYSNLMH